MNTVDHPKTAYIRILTLNFQGHNFDRHGIWMSGPVQQLAERLEGLKSQNIVP